MTTTQALKVYHGSANPADHVWEPFEWEEPVHGPQVKGEYCVVRPKVSEASMMAGFWRTSPTAPGCEADGSCHVVYSAPLGDETIVLIEGSATITVTSTGKQYEIGPGSIVSHPKGLEVTWDIKGPYLKKYWVLWDSPKPATQSHDLYIGNVNDNPDEWETYRWTEPVEGDHVCGELYFIRSEGSTGTLLAGIWRSGVGIPGCGPDGTASVPYTAVLGDESALILEGNVHVRNDETGEEYEYKAGDICGLSHGLHQTWTMKTPFVKKFWVITNENLPA
ncbi:cupin domain-containing protein [Rhodococcus jostii]|uniref:Cupin domain-containing protein n=1 Tax=Rhodococcus jostii TaxID=132919 RepID=A0ABU4CT31_RHOJO|nr:cupin domain-containing protein [Rhodococcus jostii]MDV6286623.1 cupin domain-containing protein [Rhodococcus jostii]